MARQFLFWKICIFSRVKEVGWHMNVKINIAEVSNPDPMYPGMRAQCDSKKCYVVVELIVVVTTYKPPSRPHHHLTSVVSGQKHHLGRVQPSWKPSWNLSTKCDFGLQIWRCNSFRCHLNPSQDGKMKPFLFSTTIHSGQLWIKKVHKEIFRLLSTNYFDNFSNWNVLRKAQYFFATFWIKMAHSAIHWQKWVHYIYHLESSTITTDLYLGYHHGGDQKSFENLFLIYMKNIY